MYNEKIKILKFRGKVISKIRKFTVRRVFSVQWYPVSFEKLTEEEIQRSIPFPVSLEKR